MKKRFITTLGVAMLISVTAIIFNGCKGKDGAPGAQGPAGTNGNANVYGVDTVTVNSADWVASGFGWITLIPEPRITQDILDKGSVQVFVLYGVTWWSFPDINGINSTQFGITLGQVGLWNANSDNSQAAIPPTRSYRIVIITASNKLENPNVDWTNYYEVKKVLHLAD